MKIGIFDSGLGGLAVFSKIAQVLPELDLVYLGDNARAPYGNRSQATIYEFTRQAVTYLFEHQDCAIVILACNTASAEALRKLQQEFLPQSYLDRKILGVIRPIVEEVGKMCAKKVVVLATRSTVQSGAYLRELRNICPSTEVVQQSAPLLVPMVEEGWAGSPELESVLKKYLDNIIDDQVDVMIPACTHYSLLAHELRKILPEHVKIFDAPQLIADALKEYLSRHQEISAKLVRSSEYTFLVTDYQPFYETMAANLFGKKVVFKKVVI